jgi:hypothetical protein
MENGGLDLNALPIKKWQGIFASHPNFSKKFSNQFFTFSSRVSLSIVTKEL